MPACQRSSWANLPLTTVSSAGSAGGIAAANELGMDVIVIDHHTVPEELPDALAIVNPKLTHSEYGSEPAACGRQR